MNNRLKEIASHFQLAGEINDIRPQGDGLINDTYFVETIGASANYILQCKNKNIFKNIPAMMDNINRVTLHLKKKITDRGGDPNRESLTLIRTTDQKLYYLDSENEYWAACLFVDNTITYSRADSPQLAEQGGRGIGLFQAMLADINEPLVDTLPGFHNMKYRFSQWDQVLANDPAGRMHKVGDEIAWIEARRCEMLTFWEQVETGVLPMRTTHNDTKISNILFDQKAEVLCVIDLDTVLTSTCLNDYGDAIRSYANAADSEDETDLANIYLHLPIFEAYTRGYLSHAMAFLTQSELDNLAFSARYITFEQTLRFLMDWIDGDKYYKVKSSTHNLERARGQQKLCQSMEDSYEQMKELVFKISLL